MLTASNLFFLIDWLFIPVDNQKVRMERLYGKPDDQSIEIYVVDRSVQ